MKEASKGASRCFVDALADPTSRESASAPPRDEGRGTSGRPPLAGAGREEGAEWGAAAGAEREAGAGAERKAKAGAGTGTGRGAGVGAGAGAGRGVGAGKGAEADERGRGTSGGGPPEEPSSRGGSRKPPLGGRRRVRTRLSLSRHPLHSASSSSLGSLPGAAEDPPPASLRGRRERRGASSGSGGGGWVEAQSGGGGGGAERGGGARWSRHSSPGASPASDSLGAFDSGDELPRGLSTDAILLSRDPHAVGAAPSVSVHIAQELEAHGLRLHAAARPLLWRLRGWCGWGPTASPAWHPLSLCLPARWGPTWYEKLTPTGSSSSGGNAGASAPADLSHWGGRHAAEQPEHALPSWRCPRPAGAVAGKLLGVGSRYTVTLVLLLGCLCLLVDVNLTRISTRPLVHPQHPGGTGTLHQAARHVMGGAFASSGLGGASSGAPGGGSPKLPTPSTTIFCVPAPFEGARGALQREAILSWLHASRPPPRVVLLGSHPTFDALARELAPHVTVDPRVGRSSRGTPLVSSALALAQRAPTEVSVLVGADVILLGGFFAALAKVGARREAWVVTGVAWGAPPGRLPFSFSLNPLRSRPGEPLVLITAASRALATEQEVAAYVEAQGSLRTAGPAEFCAWNNLKGVPLITGPVPPFAHIDGHRGYYSWLAHEAAVSGLRSVVDASLVATSIRVQLDNSPMASVSSAGNLATQESDGQLGPLLPELEPNGTQSFEALLNGHLAYRYGTNFSEGVGTARHAPWKLAHCVGPGGEQDMCLLQRTRPGACSCEDAPLVHHEDMPMRVVEGRKWQCGVVNPHTRPQLPLVPGPGAQWPQGLPHTLPALLQEVAPDGASVVLTGVSGAYLPLLHSFACQLRQLQVSRLIVAAYDEEAYVGALEQGLAVYYEPAAWNASEGAPLVPLRCTREAPCAASQFAALKAAAVARVLDAGHGVLWSDVDVVWRADALPLLEKAAKKASALFLEAQDDPFQESASGRSLEGRGAPQGQSAPPAAAAALDIGCFFLPCTKKTAALMHSLRRQALSLLGASEQRMYTEELCGLDGSRFDPTVQECVTQDGLGVLLFTPWLATRTGTGTGTGRRHEQEWSAPASVVLHATRVSGVDNKTALLKAHGAWRYNEEAMMCVEPWHVQP